MRKILHSTFVLLASCASQQPIVDGQLEGPPKSLGHGYSIGVVAQEVHGGFESIGHFSHCFYQRLDLGPCDKVLPSPSGKFALYFDDPTGRVMFFSAIDGKISPVTNSYQGPLNSATWQEKFTRVDFVLGEYGAAHALYFLYGKPASKGN